MDVRRIVVTPVEANNDSEEFAYFRHNLIRFYRSVFAKVLHFFYIFVFRALKVVWDMNLWSFRRL